MKSKSGFTIVELLIVIVVIAILAAITIVAYNGIQDRAENARRISAARDWINGFKEYLSTSQSYPMGFGTYCIGNSNPTNLDANSDIDCGIDNNIKHDPGSVTTNQINNAYKTVRSQLPDFPGTAIQLTAGNKAAGIMIRTDQYTDPQGNIVAVYPTIVYFLKGANVDCGLAPLANNFQGNFSLGTGKNSFSDVGTACRVLLPNPATL